MGIRDLFVLIWQLFVSMQLFQNKKQKAQNTKGTPAAQPTPGPPHTPHFCPHLSALVKPRGVEGGGAQPRRRSPEVPAASPGSHACAVSAPGRRASPSPPRGTRLPWPLRAAVFSGSWDSSCCPHPQPPLVPTSEPLTRPLPSSGRSAAAAGASPVRTLRPLARPASAAVRRPLLCLPRGSGECPAAFSPSRAFSFISAAPDSLGTLSFPTAPSFQPCLSVPQPLSSAF